jgi:predicted DNA-binding ribbon-helix-helix protein
MKTIERVQTGLRLEKRLLKVLKALAEYFDMPVAELIEGMALYALEGKAPPFSTELLAKIEGLKAVYGLDLTAADAHHLSEGDTS